MWKWMNRHNIGEQRGGKVTDGLVRIRGKSGWVSDGNSPKTEEGAMRERRGKGEGNPNP